MHLLQLIALWTLFYALQAGKSRRFVVGTPFPVPTTFPVPTLPNGSVRPGQPQYVTSKPFLTGSSLMSSARVQCPRKRDAGVRRILLDGYLMRELYLELNKKFDLGLQGNLGVEALFVNKKNNHASHETRGNKLQKFPKLNFTEQFLWRSALIEILGALEKGSALSALSNKDIQDEVPLNAFEGRRVKRDTIGASASQVEYCTPRGTGTGTGYIHLCSTCALTTQFPDNTYPRYINEVTCDQRNCDCFVYKHTAHGQCQPVIQNVKMLRRKSDGCRLIIRNGQQIIVDDWELYDQPLHVGCECLFHKNSLFATFIPMK